MLFYILLLLDVLITQQFACPQEFSMQEVALPEFQYSTQHPGSVNFTVRLAKEVA